jgi:hypothetical protein
MDPVACKLLTHHHRSTGPFPRHLCAFLTACLLHVFSGTTLSAATGAAPRSACRRAVPARVGRATCLRVLSGKQTGLAGYAVLGGGRSGSTAVCATLGCIISLGARPVSGPMEVEPTDDQLARVSAASLVHSCLPSVGVLWRTRMWGGVRCSSLCWQQQSLTTTPREVEGLLGRGQLFGISSFGFGFHCRCRPSLCFTTGLALTTLPSLN